MKILQIVASYKPAYIYGGPIMSVAKLSEQLTKAGCTIEVFTTTANGNAELPVEPGIQVNVDGVPVTYFKRITKDHSHFSPALIRKLWKNAPDCDLIHIHAWWNFVSVTSCFIALLRNIPVVVSPRGTLSPYSFNNKNIGIKWLFHNLPGKLMLKNCHLHVTSIREKDAVLNIIRPKSIQTIPNFVKLPSREVSREHSISTCFKLIFFSRIQEKKGLDILFEALAAISAPYLLTIAGDGNKDYIAYLKTITVKHDIDDKVNWIGFQTENKFELLSDHDLFVLPSYDENFGNAVIESLSVGTAVLISEQVGLANYVKENDLGWISQTNAASLGNQLIEIITQQSDKLITIRKDAPEIIYKDFAEEELVKKYINMYSQIKKR